MEVNRTTGRRVHHERDLGDGAGQRGDAAGLPGDRGRCGDGAISTGGDGAALGPERAAWLDGQTSFYTVWAWRALAMNIMASVTIGEPSSCTGG
ncbi:hypothetical protein NKH77_18755 [Streptomyces sp. M19]